MHALALLFFFAWILRVNTTHGALDVALKAVSLRFCVTPKIPPHIKAVREKMHHCSKDTQKKELKNSMGINPRSPGFRGDIDECAVEMMAGRLTSDKVAIA